MRIRINNNFWSLLLLGAAALISTSTGRAACNYSLSPTIRTNGFGAVTNTVDVSTTAGCNWRVTNTASWITIQSSTDVTGPGSVIYAVADNPTLAWRSAVIFIATNSFTVWQKPLVCSYSISPDIRTNGFGISTNTVDVMTDAVCAWRVTNTASWITIQSSTNVTGPGTVTYRLANNPTLAWRSAVISIATNSFTVWQRPLVCSYSISPDIRTNGYGISTNTVDVMTDAVCAWRVTNTASWITIQSSTNVTGPGTVTYRLANNPTLAWRSAVISIATNAFTVWQRPLVCSYSISPSIRTNGYGMATNTVDVTTDSVCPWSVTNTASWISIVSGASGTGNGTVTYTVADNPTLAWRSAVISVGTDSFTVWQRPLACSYSVSPSIKTNGYGMTTNMVEVTTSAVCPWTVTNTTSWISILSGASGTGTGTVIYAVADNPNPAWRMGVVMVANNSFTVWQRPVVCSYSLSRVFRLHGPGAATNFVELNTSGGCAWSLINTSSWIIIISGTNGLGNATVDYRIEPNPNSTPRSGTIVAEGETFTVSQDAALCKYDISPNNATHGFGADTGMVVVTAVGGCNWAVTNINSWISIHPPTNGTGNGSVGYSVAANLSASWRTGMVSIADETFSVIQVPFGTCDYSLSPIRKMHGYTGASNKFKVVVGSGCDWTVSNPNNWITITSNASGSGTRDVYYTVSPNTNFIARTGQVMVANQTFSIEQSPWNCIYKLSDNDRTHGFAAITNFVDVTVNSNCTWQVFNTNAWIVIRSGASGVGNGRVTYSLEPNLTNTSRAGFVSIAEEVLAVTQRGATNGFTIESITQQGGGQMKVRLAGAPGGVWELQASSDLEQWVRLADVTNVTGVVEFIDSGAVFFNHRFYRAVR